MKLEFDEPAYTLDWEVHHFEDCGLDWGEDLLIQKYDNYVSWAITDPEPFQHPNLVIFTAYRDVVKHIDYPYPNNSWNVMSQRMINTLLSVGSFPHRLIPVAVVDWRVQKKDWYDTNGSLRKEITLSNYAAVQITQYSNVFDYEKSEYTRREDNPNWFDIEKYVFKVPSEGLPPLFRIKEQSTSLFVSAEARAALKQAGITGTRYLSLQGFSKQDGGNYTDVPIVLPAEVYA